MDHNRTNKNVFVISGFFKKKPLCLFLSAVIYLQLGSSLSPSTMTGGTCQRIGAVAFGEVHTATKVCRFILTEQAVFADETGAHGKGLLDIFIVRR